MLRFRSLLIALLLFWPAAALADEKPLARFDEPGTTSHLEKEVGNLGFRFTAVTAFTVTALGYYDVGGHSMVFAHPVAIYDDKGKEVEGSRTLVGPKAALGLDGFRWITIKPLALKAGTYTVSASMGVGSGPDNVFTRNVKGLKLAEGFSYGGGVTNDDPVFGVGDKIEPGVNFFGPNLKVAPEASPILPTPTPTPPPLPTPIPPTPPKPLPEK